MNGSERRVAPIVEHGAERRAVDVGSGRELLVRHVRDDSCMLDLANIESPSTGARRDCAGHRSRYGDRSAAAMCRSAWMVAVPGLAMRLPGVLPPAIDLLYGRTRLQSAYRFARPRR